MTEPTIPMLYTDWQRRVYDEYEELSKKLKALIAYRQTEAFHNLPEHDKILLSQQSYFMRKYQMVLQERIAEFNRVDS